MFTGLIESTGTVQALTPTGAGFGLQVGTAMSSELSLGDSIAISGVCLTVTALRPDGFDAEISPETARVTTLGGLAANDLVNLERPLRADARLGGHFVQGHVDATGRILEIRTEAEFHRVTIGFPVALRALMVPRGSVAVDGVSLTILDVRGASFDVQFIPFTWDHTTSGRYREQAAVNLECDILGKYVARALEALAVRGESPASHRDR